MNHYVYAMPQGRMTIVDSGGAVVRIGLREGLPYAFLDDGGHVRESRMRP